MTAAASDFILVEPDGEQHFLVVSIHPSIHPSISYANPFENDLEVSDLLSNISAHLQRAMAFFHKTTIKRSHLGSLTLTHDIWFTLIIVYKMCFVVCFFFLSIQFRIIHCIELLHFFSIFSSRAWLSSHDFLSFITLTCFKRPGQLFCRNPSIWICHVASS